MERKVYFHFEAASILETGLLVEGIHKSKDFSVGATTIVQAIFGPLW